MATIFNGPLPGDSSSTFGNYPVGVPRRLQYPDIPAWGLLDRAAKLFPGRLACLYNDIEWTYEELNLDAIRTTQALKRLGVESGDRVGVLLPNIPEYIIALNGIWRSGGIAVALSPLSVPEEVDRLLCATDCRVVICLDMLASLISGPNRPEKTLFLSLRPRLPLFEQLGYLFLRKRRTGHWWMSANEHVSWFWDELNEEGAEKAVGQAPTPGQKRIARRDYATRIQADTFFEENRGWGPGHQSSATHLETSAAIANNHTSNWSETPAYILPTGGTTGEPKAVTLSHRNMVANAWQQYYWAGAGVGKERLLAVLPFFHSYGLSTNVMGGAAMAATLIMDHRFSPRRAIRLIEKHRPTIFHAVPAMLAAMNELLRERSADLSSLKWVISGGAPLSESIGREFADHSNAIVVEGYGLSEASPVTHVGPLTDAARYGTIGLPLPDTHCRIVDPDNGRVEVPRGDIGELFIKGPQVMLGYWQDVREQLKRNLPLSSHERWLPTGDLARVTSDGFFQIVERKKDLIITSGFNVYPQEVEQVLKSHPAVKDAAVVGIPDDVRGQIVTAFVTLEHQAEWDLSELMSHCRDHLAAHKRPRRIEQCKDDLPRSFLGKVIRRKLKERDTTEDQNS